MATPGMQTIGMVAQGAGFIGRSWRMSGKLWWRGWQAECCRYAPHFQMVMALPSPAEYNQFCRSVQHYAATQYSFILPRSTQE
jgi:hypothetical protein